jgi:hypothetical protein
MSFPASVKGPGQCMGMPDVCKTPAPPGSPVPVPYPNIAMCAQVNPATASLNVLFANQNALTTQSQIIMSSGDEAGSVGGVVSGIIKGPMKYMMGSMIVKVNGSPCVRLLSTTAHNNAPNANMPQGMQIVPGVLTVLIGG